MIVFTTRRRVEIAQAGCVMLHVVVEVLKYVAILLTSAAAVYAVVAKARERKEPLSREAWRAIAMACASFAVAVALQFVNALNASEAASKAVAKELEGVRNGLVELERGMTHFDDAKLFVEVDVTSMHPDDLTAFAKTELATAKLLSLTPQSPYYKQGEGGIVVEWDDPRLDKKEWVAEVLREMQFHLLLYAGPRRENVSSVIGKRVEADREFLADAGTRRLVFADERWFLRVYQAPLIANGQQRIRSLYSLLQLQGGRAVVTIWLPPVDRLWRRQLLKEGTPFSVGRRDRWLWWHAKLVRVERSVAGQHAIAFPEDSKTDVRQEFSELTPTAPGCEFEFPQADAAFDRLRGSPRLPWHY